MSPAEVPTQRFGEPAARTRSTMSLPSPAREAHPTPPALPAPSASAKASSEGAGRNEERVFAACAAAIGLQCIVQSAAVSNTANELAHRPLWLGALAMPLAALLFSRAHRAVRAVLALLLGLIGVALGVATSVAHAALAGAATADLTGIVATVAGLILTGLGFRVASRVGAGRRNWSSGPFSRSHSSSGA